MTLFHKREINMLDGPLIPNIIRYSLPLMLSGILQLLYNAADIIVVGQFAGDEALAAVSSTGALVSLIVNLFIGLSLGAGVLVAQETGAGEDREVSKTVHTALPLALICGLTVAVIGLLFSRPMLEVMGSPENVIDLSTLYLKIFFCGQPFNLIYNYSAAILRAVGDTKRPLYILSLSGIVNVILNLFFVIVLKMSVAGVALATVISQVMSAVLVVICLLKTEKAIRLIPAKLTVNRKRLAEMLKIGLPAGIQGALFSVSNVIIQSNINFFGSDVMAGNGAAANLEGFIYTTVNAVYQANLTFSGQNMGAKKYGRLTKIMLACLGVGMGISFVLGGLFDMFSHQLLSIYSPDEEVIQRGMLRISIMCVTYVSCGAMDVLVGSIRGMGHSFVPMCATLIGVCLLRVVWIYTVFAADPRLEVLYYSYPVSWTITACVHLICYFIFKAQLNKQVGVNGDEKLRTL